ncbi:MAG: hypothetical protein ACLPYZ_01705 [Limisphaerales bacterium]
MKLGKNAPRHDVRTLQMAQYLQPEALPKIPPSQEWYDKVSQWPMMMNNRSARNSCSFSGEMPAHCQVHSAPCALHSLLR